MRYAALFLAPLLLAGCVQAIAESRVRSALSEAGLNDRVSDCMAGRMVDRVAEPPATRIVVPETNDLAR